MRRSIVITALVLVALSIGIARWQRPQREWSTRSAKAATLYAQGEEQLRAYRWQEAERTLAAAVAEDPGFAMAHAALAEVRAALGDRDRSREAAHRADSLAARLRDESERLAIQLRVSNVSQPFLARRDSLLARLERQRPDCLIVAISRARVAERERDAAAEEAAWRDALRIDPNYANAWNQLGYLAARHGRYEEAESHLAKYAYLAPEQANPHDSLGEILLYQGKYERAEAEFKRSLALQPDFFPSLLSLAVVFVERGQVGKGVGLLEKVRGQIAGTDWEQRVDGALIRAYYDHDLRRELQAAVARWIDAYPKDWQTPYYRALARALAGDHAGALAACDSFAAKPPSESWYDDSPRARAIFAGRVHACRGMLVLEAGDPAAAAAEFALAIAQYGNEPLHETWSLHLRHGEALLRAGAGADALAEARSVLALNPRRLRALVLEARALLALGRRDEARESLARLRSALAQADPAVIAAVEGAAFVRELAGAPTRPAS